VNPTLGLEIGVTHTFLQTHDHNYYHPLGFAYFPDGDHAGLDELEPGIPPPDSDSDCAETMTCPAPMYFLNGQYLGSYSNDPDVLKPTTNKANFGLDEYEPVFYYPYDQWLGLGKFSVNLRFDQVYDKDIFYFCHVSAFPRSSIDGQLLRTGSFCFDVTMMYSSTWYSYFFPRPRNKTLQHYKDPSVHERENQASPEWHPRPTSRGPAGDSVQV
jgi:hypothetical protein